jgi:hypothetical protein
MASYSVNFSNQTDRVWTMAVYQTIPNSIGLESVSWQQSTAPRGGFTGVKWQVNYNVALADYSQDGGKGVYTASQVLTATLGSVWNIIFDQNVQQLVPGSGTAQPNQILINNQSNRIANPGIGMSGQGSVYKRDMQGGASAQFEVTPTYFVGLFNDVQRGEVISSNVIVGPLTLQYPTGFTSATLTATLDGANIILDLSYGDSLTMSLAEVDERSRLVTASRRALTGAR